ncbi:MAG: tRNA-uridine aminocarboxypropyltransferase [Pirellulales bacterium]
MPGRQHFGKNIRKIDLQEPKRQRCYECFRPLPLCFCSAIPQIDNRTNVLILQHVGERFHPFNTARIVRKALRNCKLIVGHNLRLGNQDLPIQASAGLLYPSANASTELSDLPPTKQLVIIDGTWHQAKTIVRDVPQLRGLPCYRFTPSSPGQYRIRREPNAQSLSTLEATVSALQTLEPDTVGLEQLLLAFHQMVKSQLAYHTTHAIWRQKKTRLTRPRNIPQAILQNADGLVAAYGEATPGQSGKRSIAPLPVNWVAKRLSTNERFSCLLQQRAISDAALKHMRLSAEDFDVALSQDEFRRQWKQFLRPHDVLVVYHHKTYQLLKHINASQPPCLVLKSIFGNFQKAFHSLKELMTIEEVNVPISEDKSRAQQRLDMAIAMTEHLKAQYGKI